MTKKPRVRVNKNGVVGVGDGFSNLVAGLGSASPKISSAFYEASSALALGDMAFRTSTWYGKILTIPVDDAVRKWRRWNAEDDVLGKIESEEKRLEYRMKVRRALLMSRHEGGALIVPGGLRGSLESPLDLGSVGVGQLQFVHVLSRHEVHHGPIIRDPRSPSFGQPEWWGFTGETGKSVRLHPTRAFPVNGRKVPGSEIRHGEFWGDSIWLYLADAVMAADSGAAIVSSLMHEAKLDVVSIPNLAATLGSPGGTTAMTQRWQLAAQMRSIANILLIDGGPDAENSKSEEWQQKQIRWDGLPDVLRILLTVLSGAADIPYTRLTGDQQKGLSNNDDGSLRNYYSSVNTRQVLEIEPMLAPLDRLLLRSAIGAEDPDLWYSWESLYEISDTERSENDKRDAETAQIYANSALVETRALETAVLTRMQESGRWPGITPDDRPTDLQRAAAAPDPGVAGGGAEGLQRPSSARGGAAGAGDAAPRTLYVRRNVLNGPEILSWAEEQGLSGLLPANDLHVTIAFSRTPIDWMVVGESWSARLELPEGGPRIVDAFGESGDAVVLLFRSAELEWRHQQIREAGASWDFPEYQPHVTVAYSRVANIREIEPYRGAIVLGPEIFEEVDEKWREKLGV